MWTIAIRLAQLGVVSVLAAFAGEDARWGVFLGMGQDASNIEDYIRRQAAAGKWVNPFTGASLEGVPVYVFGKQNRLLETARVLGDHLEIRPHSVGGLSTDSIWTS